MGTHLNDKVAPKSMDLAGWLQAVVAGRHHGLRSEDLVAAIQDLGPGADKAVLNPLAKDVSDRMMHMLRSLVGRHHPNEGRDIIEDTHAKLWASLLQPDSPDGWGLRTAFHHRVRFRVLDVLRRESRSSRSDCAGPSENGGCDELHLPFRGEPPLPMEATAADGPEIPEQVAVAEMAEKAADLVSMVPDDRKRLAFHLHLDGVPFKSKRSASIAKALGVSERTARKWVKEVLEALQHCMGDES